MSSINSRRGGGINQSRPRSPRSPRDQYNDVVQGMLDPIYAQKLHYLLINRNIEEIKREVSIINPQTLERVVNLVQSNNLTISDEVERLDDDDFKKEVIDILNIQPNFEPKGGRRRRRTRSRSRKTRRTRRTRRRRYSKK